MKLLAAVAQIDAAVGNVPKNVETHLRLIQQAVERGASLIVFPELSLTGYTLRDLAWDVAVNPHTSDVFKPLLEVSAKISIALGFVERGEDHGIYNAAAFLEGGSVKHLHRKIYPPTYGMFEEGRYFSKGSTVAAFESKHGRFGMLVCEDFWHVSLPYLLGIDGAEAMFCLTASPTRLAGEGAELSIQSINHDQHRAYGRLLSSYILFSNRVGFEDGVNFWGGSAITDPNGVMVAKATLMDEALIVAELDSNVVERARRFSRHTLDEQPEVVGRNLRRILRSDARLRETGGRIPD
jgi:predicted amidohydrolase